MNELEITSDNLKKACEVFNLDYESIVKGETTNPFLMKAEKNDIGEGTNSESNADLLFKALGVEPAALKVAISVLPKMTELGELVKSLEDTLNDTIKNLPSSDLGSKVDTLIKGYNSAVELNGQLKDELRKAQEDTISLQNRIKRIEDTPIRDKKSITSNSIEKAYGGQEDTMEGKTVFSLTRNKSNINALLGDRMQEEIQKGIADGPFQNAAMNFEASGRLSRTVIETLNKDGIVLVQ